MKRLFLVVFFILYLSSSAFSAVELDADFNGAVDVDKGGTNVQAYNDLKTALSIDEVDNTSDANKPVSTLTQTELDSKEDDLGNPPVNGYVLSSTIAGFRAWIDVSGGTAIWGSILGTLADQTDLQNEFDLKQNLLTFGISDGNSILVDSASVGSGEYAIFTPLGLQSFSIAQVKSNLSIEQLDNTSDLDKPVSTDQQTAFDLKEDTLPAVSEDVSFLTSLINTTRSFLTITETKTALSIENVDNTADIDKIISTLQQNALDLKLDISSAFDPDSPGELGATTPAKGNFTEVEIPFVDGAAGVGWLDFNTSYTPAVGFTGFSPYIDNLYKVLDGSIVGILGEIDDTAGDGDTAATWSANKIFDELASISGVSVTYQTADPVLVDMSEGDIICARTSGDVFIKGPLGGWTLDGVYAADPVIPTLTTWTVQPDGISSILVFSEAMTFDTGGSGGFTTDTPTYPYVYVSGDTTDTVTFSHTQINSTATDNPTGDFVQPTDGWQSVSGSVELAGFTGGTVINNSTQTPLACSGSAPAGDNESFESGIDAFCTTGWTLADTDGVISTYSTAYANTGTHSLEITSNDGNTTEPQNKAYINLGTTYADAYERFYFFTPAAMDDATKITFHIVGDDDSETTSGTYWIELERATATHRLKPRSVSSNPTEYFDLALGGTKYRVEVKLIQNSAVCNMKVFDASGTPVETSNGGGDVDIDFTTPNIPIQYSIFSDNTTSAIDLTWGIDDYKIVPNGTGYIGPE